MKLKVQQVSYLKLKNKNKMNKKITVFVMALMLTPLVGISQDIFEKYNDNTDVTYVSIKPKMFQMITKMGINVDEPEAKAYMDMVQSITSFRTIVTDNKTISADMDKWVKTQAGFLEELMEVKEEGSEVKFYVKGGKDANHVNELLIFVNGMNNLMKEAVEVNDEQRRFETVIVSMTGDINLNEISKLTEKMNIPGGNHLEKRRK